MARPPEKRVTHRVEFSRAIDVQIIAIDGTWRRPCKMRDVSALGAKLDIDDVASLPAKEFFLVLSTTGTAYRRCELAWVNGGQIGVRFLESEKGKAGTK